MVNLIPETKTSFFEMIGLKITYMGDGRSQCKLEVSEKLFNPQKVLHGGIIYSMADTGLGAAVYSIKGKDEFCATIELKISYFKAVRSGTLVCDTKVVNKGKSVAFLESEIKNGDDVVAKANGTFSLFVPGPDKNRSD
jgi:acyl-CoA thioesterase